MEDGEWIPISALQHYAYCPRQCALIHIEHAWDDNLFTMRGDRVHDRVDSPGHTMVKGVRQERALPIWSEALGITGRADVVEFLSDGTPYIVEHKAGKKGKWDADEIQVCAQAFCLEAMVGRAIPEGAIFYHRSGRRVTVAIDAELRQKTVATIQATRRLWHEERLPPPVADSRCDKCSLKHACLPYAIQGLQA